jgi:hypothetical protein
MFKIVNIDKIVGYMWDTLTIHHYEKRGVLQLAL